MVVPDSCIDRTVAIPRVLLWELVGFLDGVAKLDGEPSEPTKMWARIQASQLRSAGEEARADRV